jgi:hypothetical protein
VVFIDQWELHPKAQSIHERKTDEIDLKKKKERDDPEKSDMASAVLEGLKKKVEKKTSSETDLDPPALPLEKRTEQKAPEQKTPEPKAPEPKAPEPKAPEPKAPEPKAPEPKAPEPKITEAAPAGEPAKGPAEALVSIPLDLSRCIDDYAGILTRAGKSVALPLLSRTVAEHPERSLSLVDKALNAQVEGDDLAFREAASELHNDQMTWKIRFARRLTRISKHLRSLLAGTLAKSIQPPLTSEEAEEVLKVIFHSDSGIEKWSEFTVSGPSEDRNAVANLSEIVEMIRKPGDGKND